MAIRKQISVGSCVATLTYVNCFIAPIQGISYDIHTLKAVQPIIMKICSYLQLNKKAVNGVMNTDDDIIINSISIELGTFKIKNMSYTFQKNKKYCIIGDSGAGKSTLLNLIYGKIKPTEGNITINGVTSDYYSDYFFYAIQLIHIYTDDYDNNVRVFNSYENDKEVNYQLTSIFTSDKLSLLKESTNCTFLSGGEKQMISFIRCMFSKCKYILFDESFSAIDYDTREKILKYICNQKKTVIMITHDIKDAKYFDTVIQLQDGGLKEV